jgi:signal transduction histidine kinase
MVVSDTRDDGALDTGTWIFAANGKVVERPAGGNAALDAQAAALAARGAGTADIDDPVPLRLLALPVHNGSGLLATVVTSVSLDPYRQVQRLTWFGSAAVALGLLVVVHLVLRANVARALRPVQEMSGQASRWSAEDGDHRFGSTPRPAELHDLARTLDGLLDRLAAVHRRERQLSDELSHELRTPLARIQAEVDLLGSRPRDEAERARALATIDEAAGSMGDILETLMTTARSAGVAPAGQCELRAVLVPLAARLQQRRPDVRVSVEVPERLTAGVDAVLLERAVSPVLDNAIRHAVARVVVSADAASSRVLLRVRDDGCGIAAGDAERVFEPGWRAEPADGHDGAGLGLALARRLVRAAGGELRVEGSTGGAVFALDLPPA